MTTKQVLILDTGNSKVSKSLNVVLHTKQVIAEAGGDVNIVDNNHNLPLWYAVSHNRPGAVKALLRANSRTDPARDSENISEGGVPLKTALVKVNF